MTESIFELLKSVRVAAMKDHNWGVLRAVEKAELAAKEEICCANLQASDHGFDAVMAEVFPNTRRKARPDA